jgi:hypothetical protein
MENDDLPLLPVNVYSLTEFPSGACEPPQVTVACTLAQGLEQVQVLAVQGVVPDGPVASDKLHLPYLAFPGVQEDAILIPPILVAVLLPALSGEQENQGPTAGCRDATLPLPPLGSVYIRTTVVDFTNLKHTQPPTVGLRLRFYPRYFDATEDRIAALLAKEANVGIR